MPAPYVALQHAFSEQKARCEGQSRYHTRYFSKRQIDL